MRRLLLILAVLAASACGSKGDGEPTSARPAYEGQAEASEPAPAASLDGVWVGDPDRAPLLAVVAELRDPDEKTERIEQLQGELPSFRVEFLDGTMIQRYDGEILKQGRYEVTSAEGHRVVVTLTTDAGVDEGIFLVEGDRLTLVSAEGEIGMVLRRAGGAP